MSIVCRPLLGCTARALQPPPVMAVRACPSHPASSPDSIRLTISHQASNPQVVLFGDSLFELCVEQEDGFSFFAAFQKREL